MDELIDNGNIRVQQRAEISNAELALIAIYEGKTIPRGDNDKGYQKFKYYEFKPNRIAHEDSIVKNKNKIKLFTQVIGKLSGDAKIKAKKELEELKENITKDVYFEGDLKDTKNTY